jgi:hypothetical protein
VKTRSSNEKHQLMLFGEFVPDGIGGFRLVPRRPRLEVPTVEAAKILGVSRSAIHVILNTPGGQKWLKWRYSTPRKGKILFEVDSLYAYLEASKDFGK